MRLSGLVLAIALMASPPALAGHYNVASATDYMCRNLNLSGKLAARQDEVCTCAANAWEDRSGAIANYLTIHAHFHEITGGDTARTDQMTATRLNMTPTEVNSQAAISRAELEVVVLDRAGS